MQLELNINGYLSQVMLMPGELNEVYKPLLKWISQLRNKQKKSRPTKILLAGPPGSGKSTIASVLEKLADQQKSFSLQALGIDAFHFTNAYLQSNFILHDGNKVNLYAIKGTPETYDIKSLLKHWHLLDNAGAKWPVYDRTVHEPITGKIVVNSEVLILEGNWVLLDEPKWRVLSEQSDLTIFLRVEEDQVRERLKSRKKKGGYNIEEVEAHYIRTDRPNIHRVLNESIPADLELTFNNESDPAQLIFCKNQDFDII